MLFITYVKVAQGLNGLSKASVDGSKEAEATPRGVDFNCTFSFLNSAKEILIFFCLHRASFLSEHKPRMSERKWWRSLLKKPWLIPRYIGESR